ncbi:unnamed protein product [Phytomonas sp. EM1]|nr:unnamed protein product [Phytomonas sp. EM1]|eukprot:CCW60251.1 unnamed protein product [Phytomonas sp. isolate EM1]
MEASSSNVPKEFLRMRDPKLLPPRVGHNWNDQAFRKKNDKPQQLEAEFRGKRAMITANGNFQSTTLPEDFNQTAHQLLLSLLTKNRGSLKNPSSSTKLSKRYLTLDDKVLCFYAFFREQAPEGGVNDFWHRKVVIDFFLEDDSILIQEPRIPNSGLDGGTFLKRQKVKADYRQMEQFPGSEYLNINYFNVGQSVRINTIDFFIYDCDTFTREFLTELGVEVGEPVDCPENEFTEAYNRHQQQMKAAINGEKLYNMTSSQRKTQAAEAERTTRFLRDSAKILCFHALLEENQPETGLGVRNVRKLDVLYYIEDDTIAITEQQTSPEVTSGLYLSRCFLPKCGSLEKANELTFAHRINGVRMPYIGPDAYYTHKDLNIGVTINVLGRPVFLYDCDSYTRFFYAERLGVHLPPAVDVTERFSRQAALMKKAGWKPSRGALPDTVRVAVPSAVSPREVAKSPKADVLRFVLLLEAPKTHEDRFRRFKLTYYTDTNEVVMHETRVNNLGFNGGCFLKRQQLRKPVPPRGPRNDPNEKERRLKEAQGIAIDTFYNESDLRIGNVITVNGLLMRITAMDAHTEAYFMGTAPPPHTPEYVSHLLEALRDFLYSRYGNACKAFLAFDHNRDGVISLSEFTESLKTFQITDDASLAKEVYFFLRNRQATSDPSQPLTTQDVMKWLGEKVSYTRDARRSLPEELLLGNASQATEEEEARRLREFQQQRSLIELQARLEGRCFNSVEMFRLASTMPRAYRECRADILTLTNPNRDAIITPVQLRRCIEEILGWSTITQEEMSAIIGFFFPEMPESLYFRQRDETLDYSVDLPTFQKLFHDICQLTLLSSDDVKTETSVFRYSLKETN